VLRDLPSSNLLSACLSGSVANAWNEFVRRFQPVIRSSVSRAAGEYGLTSPSFIEDLEQEVYLRLCDSDYRTLREFHSEHPESLASFLKVMAGNTARDRCRSLVAQKRSVRKVVALPEDDIGTPHAETANPSQIETRLLMTKIDEILAEGCREGMLQRDRSIFWMYYRQGFTCQDIAAVRSIGLTSKSVERVLHRMVRIVRSKLADPGKGGIFS